MNKKKAIVLIFFFIIQSVFYLSDIYAQGSLRGSIREGIRERRQKKQQKTNKLGAGDYDFSLVHDGLKRTYKVHVSAMYDEKSPVPLLLAFHGYLGQGENMNRLTLNAFDKLSDSDNFIVVYPDGIEKSWNVGQGNIPAANLNIDDVGFTRVLIEDLKRRFNIDSERVYATGMSNGAYFCNRLGCELSDMIAAIAPVAGEMPEVIAPGCNPVRPVPVIIFHGTKDPYALYDGGKSGRGIFILSAEESGRFWAEKNSCDPTPVVKNLPDAVKDGTTVTQILYTNCKQDADVILYKINDGGHTWPRGWQYLPRALVGKTSQDIDACEVIWEFFQRHPMKSSVSSFEERVIQENSVLAESCGDGLCTKVETKASCPTDCDEITCRELYAVTEQACLEKGWKKVKINVGGLEREMLWKAPQIWKHGAIIVMHGGEGVDSNFCSSVPLSQRSLVSAVFRGVPAEEFGELAVKEGLAVFSLNSAYNRVTDSEGRSVGKRWDSLAQKGKDNIDLPFIEKVIDETIPNLRPAGSSKDIFITGISNGGFMTILAATHFSEKIKAFAPVSAGDPYGTYFDMGKKNIIERKCAPGAWRDNETNREIKEKNACLSDGYVNEIAWPKTKSRIPFRQFHNQGDAGCDISCMQKVRTLLVEHGYKDEGAFIIDYGKRGLEEHFWQREYNQPLIEFFKKYANRNQQQEAGF